jgi:prepilin-type N-terminal cleavage/methylation domain-containing protein
MFLRQDSRRGFTLLEMLFVLVVVGLLVGLTVPRFAAGFAQRELIAQRADIEDQLRELPRRVRLNATPIVLPKDMGIKNFDDGLPSLHLPDGWEITFKPALEISMLGTCSASTLTLTQAQDPRMNAGYAIASLNCELSAVQP